MFLSPYIKNLKSMKSNKGVMHVPHPPINIILNFINKNKH